MTEPKRRGKFWCIRVRMTPTERPWVRVARATEPLEHARNRARVWMDERDANIAAWLADREAERLAPAPAPKGATTVRQLAEAWTSGALLKKHGTVSRLRERKLTNSRQVLARCCAVEVRGRRFGDIAVADVIETDIEACLHRAPRPGASPRTVLTYYGALHRLFELAERPARLRDLKTSPVDAWMRPALNTEKVYSFLLPQEVEAVLRYTGPIRGKRQTYQLTEADLLRWKVLLVLGCYIGLRKENLRTIRWRDVDLATGSFMVLRTKTGVPVHATLHFPCVTEILKRWRKHTPARDNDPIVRISDRQRRRAKHVLHTILRAAGVTREVLFMEDAKVEPIRFHDLRSTFVTWAKRAGLTDDFIKARTGHMTQAMLDRYTRLSTTVDAAVFVPFPDVSDSIPELPPGPKLGTVSLDGADGSSEPAGGSARHAGAVPRLQNGEPRRQRSLEAEILRLNALDRIAGSPPQEPAETEKVATEVATRIGALRGLARAVGGPPEMAALEMLELAAGTPLRVLRGGRS